MKIMIIALSGPDGTGKTSCAKILSILLRKRGVDTNHVWVKHVHTFAYIIVRMLEIISRRQVVRSPSGTFVSHSMARYSKLWMWIEFLGILPLILRTHIYAKLSNITKKSSVIIADRYILDSLVHIVISLVYFKGYVSENDIDKTMRFLPFKILRAFLIKSTLNILLDGNVDVLMKRKKDRSDPRNYLRLQRLLYKLISSKLSIPIIYIDTTDKPLHTVCSDIIQRLMVMSYGQ